jgi:hypothetical protein
MTSIANPHEDSQRELETCARCRRGEAVARRRTVSAVSTWTLPMPVCARCRNELDDLSERCNRGAIGVDRAVHRVYEGLLRAA